MKLMFSSKTTRGLFTDRKTILMNYSCLDPTLEVSLDFKTAGKHGWYFEGISFPIPLYSISMMEVLVIDYLLGIL